MKIILMALILIFLFAPSSQAEKIPATVTNKAYSDGVWYPSSTANVLNINNKDGLAWRFVLEQNWTVSSLSGFLTGIDQQLGNEPGPGHAKFYLYQRSSLRTQLNYLQPNKLIYTSDLLSVPLDGQISQYKVNDVNLNLSPGDYWFGANGGAGNGYLKFDKFELEGQVTTPEPATMLLFGSGLIGAAVLRRRKNRIGL